MTQAYLALGSNLGDRKAILDSAVASLAQLSNVSVTAVSTYHETAPIGGPDGQGTFLNAAAVVETELDPLTLLNSLRAIESAAGRIRTIHWGERTLDLDILLFGSEIIETAELTLPHPRMGVRRFVLAPLAEIAPDAIDPISRLTVRELLAQLDRRPSYLAIGTFPDQSSGKVFKLVKEALQADPVYLPSFSSKATRENLRSRSDLWHEDRTDITAHLIATLPADRVDHGPWLVSDFWADRILFGLWFWQTTGLSTTFALPDSNSADPPPTFDIKDIMAIRNQLLSPTFVAIVRPEGSTIKPCVERVWSAFDKDESTQDAEAMSGRDQEQFDRITSAFRAALPPNCTLLPIVANTPELIAAEIVSACRASHP